MEIIYMKGGRESSQWKLIGGVSMALDIPKIVEWLLGGTAVALVSSFLLWMIGSSMSSEDIWLIVGIAIISIWLGWFWMILRSLR